MFIYLVSIILGCYRYKTKYNLFPVVWEMLRIYAVLGSPHSSFVNDNEDEQPYLHPKSVSNIKSGVLKMRIKEDMKNT